MTTILQLASGLAWRQHLRPASFKGAPFHVEAGVKESGRRVVTHEFPKRNVPYAEDMGKRATEFNLRGYIIVYPEQARPSVNVAPRELRRLNYLPARDRLIEMLEEDGEGLLQTPLLGSMVVMVTRYRVTEESRVGGMCVFDMAFVEFGKAPGQGSRDTVAKINGAARNLDDTTRQVTQQKLKQEADRPIGVLI